MQTKKKPRIIGAVLTTALLCTTGVACSGGDSDAKSDGSSASPAKALTAAFKKTTDAKSAKVDMTMRMPFANGGGDMDMSGVVGWEPSVMDVTLTGSSLGDEPGTPDKSRTVQRDGVMYMDMGSTAASGMEGKRWLKMDTKAVAEYAEETKDPTPRTMLDISLENTNQDPAQQLALLLESPDLKHVGTQKIDGAEAEHYKGKLTVAEMLKTNDALADLDKEERDEFLKSMKKAGVKGYDIEAWVNGDDLPVRMDVKTQVERGVIDISTKYSDYGTEVKAEVPKASETLDLLETIKKLDKEDPA
ncbi:hypothetical protein [Streptomyces uncialis]|uniref:hypothetical protein n=1 Tax=Streptomyces uncialis TaxID=1048205 RepID=UPI0022535096|nr:hypothetical protein [Streptomyces uncialis]MCX4664388.1 hypothetical protein [Streptomyces uncialis]